MVPLLFLHVIQPLFSLRLVRDSVDHDYPIDIAHLIEQTVLVDSQTVRREHTSPQVLDPGFAGQSRVDG